MSLSWGPQSRPAQPLLWLRGPASSKEQHWFEPPGVWHTRPPPTATEGKPLRGVQALRLGEGVGTALTISPNHLARHTVKLHPTAIILHTS